MSELKRNDNEFQSGSGGRPAAPATPGIDESQPRQTLEMNRVQALLEGSQQQGSDPYNTVGAHAFSRQTFKSYAA